MLPNSFLALQIQLAQGVTIDVQCTKRVEDFEAYPDSNMRTTLKSISPVDGEGVAKLHISYQKFDEYNKTFEQQNYYKDGIPNKTAREVGLYTVEDTLYVMLSDDPNIYFTRLNAGENRLYDAYQSEKQGEETYVQYLERLVLEHVR